MRKLDSNQSGLVSIVISMVLVLVLTITVLSFARLTQREQRQVLDRQLSNAAFYAAETGINDGSRALRDDGPEVTEETDDCDAPSGYNNQVGSANIVYSCLLIDPSPTSLEYNNIGRGEAKVFPIQPRSGLPSAVTIYWQQPDTSPSFTGCPNATAANLASSPRFGAVWYASCSTGVLRVDLVRIANGLGGGGPVEPRNSLISNTATYFAVPVRTTSAVGTSTFAAASGGSPSGSNQGVMIAAGCQAATSPTRPKHCGMRITGMNAGGTQKYIMRIVPIYYSAEVAVCSPDCNASAVELTNAQAQIDSTGRANDVLRRIQVRVGIGNYKGTFPLGALESNQGICKRLIIAPPDAPSDSCGPL